MTTLTIELPEPLAQQVQAHGISPQRLEEAIIHFVQIYLEESQEAQLSSAGTGLTDGSKFARQVIANNRELFEELAKVDRLYTRNF
jgi:hypothetical protein